MADITSLADMIRQASFYANGGVAPGQSINDKMGRVADLADKTINDVLTIKKANLDRQKTQAETGKNIAETNKANIESTPIVDTYVTPKVQSTLAQAQNSPIPTEDLVSGNLNTMQEGIDTARQQALEGQQKYGKLTPGEYSKMTGGGLKEIQGEKINTDPTRKNIGELFPGITPQTIEETFGKGVTIDTPYIVALGVKKATKGANDSLSPEALDYWSNYVAKTGSLPSNMGFGVPGIRKSMLEEGARKGAEAGTSAADQVQKFKAQSGAMTSSASANSKVQDAKVNQATDLQNLLTQNWNPNTKEFVIPPAQHSEIALGVARLLSPTGQVPIELEKQLRQQTGRESLAKMLIFVGADPAEVGGTTQSVTRYLAHTIARQGDVAQKLRDTYTAGKVGSQFDSSILENIVNQNNESSSPKTVPIGTLDNGYRFKGGNPADQNNWVKVQ